MWHNSVSSIEIYEDKINLNKSGVIKISDKLIITPGLSFEEFKHTEFYENQDGIRIIQLDEEESTLNY